MIEETQSKKPGFVIARSNVTTFRDIYGCQVTWRTPCFHMCPSQMKSSMSCILSVPCLYHGPSHYSPKGPLQGSPIKIALYVEQSSGLTPPVSLSLPPDPRPRRQGATLLQRFMGHLLRSGRPLRLGFRLGFCQYDLP